MNKQQILEKLPERIRDKIIITERREFWAVSHPFVDDESLFALTREAIEDLGGKYGGYHTKAAHYEIPKETSKPLPSLPVETPQSSVTPHVVSTDKSKPPKVEKDRPAIYKKPGSVLPEEIGVKLVNVDDLVQSPFWTRKFVEDENFIELAESIRQYGVAQNLLVRYVDKKMEIVVGHRRWLAARKAGLTQIPVKIRNLSDEEVLLLQFDENERRKDLTDIEKAHSLRRMIDFFDCTQEALAQKLGKSRQWITNHMRMLKLEEGHPGVIVETGELTERQARELLKVPEEKREEILQKAKINGKIPSARTIRDLAQLHQCNVPGCLVRTGVEEWNGRGIWLCPKHMKDAEMNPAKFLGLKRTKEVTEQIKTVKPQPIKDTWEQRKARMHPQHSRMEQAQLLKLQQASVRPVVTDRPFCIKKTIPDLYFPTKHLAIYLDHPATHKNRELKDEKLRTALAKQHGLTVKSIEYTSFTEKEVDRVFVLVKEAYENA